MVRYNIIAILMGFISTTKADFMDGILSEEEKQDLLDQHNDLRSETARGLTEDQPMAKNMIKLEWDEELAEQAKAHADLCVWEHSTGSWGENLAASAAQSQSQLSFNTLTSGVTNWYTEHLDYTFDSNSCSGVCGHYTQVVWATSTKIGCAYQICGPGFIWDDTFPYQTFLTCQYTPPGNYVGVLPYVAATSNSEIASDCSDGYVGNPDTGLCEMPSVAPSVCLDSTFSVSGTSFGCAEILAFDACGHTAASSHCPVSCDTCDELGCSDSELSFDTPSGQTVNCGMMASLDQSDINTYCTYEPIYTTCRGLCNTCDMEL